MRRRERVDGLVRGLGYGLVYIAVSAGTIEIAFALVEGRPVTVVASSAVLVFAVATVAAAGCVWWLWRRFDRESAQ